MFDAHCHLEGFERPQEMLGHCKSRLNGLITCGSDLPTSKRNIGLAEANKDYVWCAAGLAPQIAMGTSETVIQHTIDYVRGQAGKLAAVGEIGLDYKWAKDEEGRARQVRAFEAQLALAHELNLPVVIHLREAEEKGFELLAKSGCERVMLHCFSGSAELAKRAADAGWFVSVPPLRSRSRTEAVKSVEPEYLLAESDAPAIGKDLLACFAGAEIIAEARGMKREDVEGLVEKNCRRLFRL
ncbi:Tat-linked quality control protein TatD [Candidatus Burarchaeum australiense]|nr:Tat-linked quality control protein TatD [Candidatus Burarchaeum australiense]